MLRVYTAQTLPKVANVKNVLESNGIPCVLRNEFLSAGFGEIPPTECWPELWIVNETDGERARQLVSEAESASTDGEPWRCQRCGEEVDALFDRCWNCETER